jgi:hypothetical protein
MSIALNFTDEQPLSYNKYELQNVSEKKALSVLKNTPNNSWIFRFDYITQKYYLTIKKDDEYINHHVYMYNKNTNEVTILIKKLITKKYSNLEEYLKELVIIYNFSLSDQIIC